VPVSASATRQTTPDSSRAPSKNVVEATTPLRAKLVGPGNAEVYVAGSKDFGRDDFSKIVSEDKLPFISRKHFAIHVSGDAYSIEDLRSNNGTMVNGERLQAGERRTLKQGDTISCGNVLQLTFQPPMRATQAGSTPQAGPSPSTRGKDRTAYFEDALKKMDFDIKQPLSHSVNELGNDVYKGTVARGMMNASVIIETCDNISDTQQRADYYKNDFIARGYVKEDEQAEFWSGSRMNGRAWIRVDTTKLHVMAFYY
jgi:pSer/pThr/pTyr-binding forkhead associated (FHA) protein